MTKGVIVRSLNTGLAYKVHDTSGSRIMVRDEDDKVINHWFEKDCFSYGRTRSAN